MDDFITGIKTNFFLLKQRTLNHIEVQLNENVNSLQVNY